MECSFNVEQFAKRFVVRVSVTFSDHPMLVLIFKLPNVFFENIVYLLFDMESVPEIKVINFIVIFFYVFLSPNLVENVGLNSHAPNMLTMLREQILRQVGTFSIHFVNHSDDLGGCQL